MDGTPVAGDLLIEAVKWPHPEMTGGAVWTLPSTDHWSGVRGRVRSLSHKSCSSEHNGNDTVVLYSAAPVLRSVHRAL